MPSSEPATAAPRPDPTTTPSSAPNTAITTDSTTIISRTWRFPAPMARSRPSSRVRSTIDSASVFTIPSTAMTIASPSST